MTFKIWLWEITLTPLMNILSFNNTRPPELAQKAASGSVQEFFLIDFKS